MGNCGNMQICKYANEPLPFSHLFPDFHTSTLSASKLITSHIFTFQSYSKVIKFMCSTFHCDDVFCVLLPQVKALLS